MEMEISVRVFGILMLGKKVVGGIVIVMRKVFFHILD
jgi:hypothetical protein